MVATAISLSARVDQSNAVGQNSVRFDHAVATQVVPLDEGLQFLDALRPEIDGQIAP